MIHRFSTIDAHVGGQALRLIVEGWPTGGRRIEQGRAWPYEWPPRRADHLRRAAVLEPRGHRDLTAAVLAGPVTPGVHAGLFFMDGDGYRRMSGHGVIGAATIALERRLLFSHDEVDAEVRLVFETPGGHIQARARLEDRGGTRRVDAVAFTAPPSFVHAAGHPVRIGSRELRVDIAFGGEFYAIVDAEATGVPLDPARIPDLRQLGAAIRRSLGDSLRVQHPTAAAPGEVAGVVFTGPPQDPEAHLRNVTVTGGGTVNRSPGGTSTAAVMAVLDAMGLLPDDRPFVHESLTGALFRGRALRRTLVGDLPALVADIEGTAWITGEHTFHLDEDDPFRDGFAY